MMKDFRWRLSPLFISLIVVLGMGCGNGSNNNSSSGGTAPSLVTGEGLSVITHRYLPQDKPIFDDYQNKAKKQVDLQLMDAEKVLAAAKAGKLAGGDLVIMDNFYDMHRLIQTGAVEPFNVGVFGERVPSRYVDNEGYWSALTRWTMSFVFRPSVVDMMQMKNYAGVLEPRYRGRVVMSHPDSSGLVTMVGYMLGAHGEETTRIYLQNLANNLGEIPQGNDYDQIKKVIDGQADIAFVSGSAFLRYRHSGNPTIFKQTDELMVEVPLDAKGNNYYDITAIGLVKQSPNRQYALAMIEFLSVKGAQEVYPHAMLEYPVNVFAQSIDFLTEIDGLPQGAYSPETAENQLDRARELIREVFGV